MNQHNKHLLILLRIIFAFTFAINILILTLAKLFFMSKNYGFCAILVACIAWICVIFFSYFKTYRKIKAAGEKDVILTDKDFL